MTNPYEPASHDTEPATAQPPKPAQPHSVSHILSAPPVPTPVRAQPPIESPGRRPRRTLRRVLIGTAVVAIAAAAGYVGLTMLTPEPLADAFDTCDGSNALTVVSRAWSSDDAATATDSPETEGPHDALAEYLDGRLSLEDDARTLVLDTLSEEDDPLGLSTFTLECVYVSLDMPNWLQTNIGATRALDGRQQAEWDRYRADWSYHPDSGLNLVIRMD